MSDNSITIFTDMGETAEASAPVVRKLFELQKERDEALDALQDLCEAIQEAGWHRSHTETAEALLRKHGRLS